MATELHKASSARWKLPEVSERSERAERATSSHLLSEASEPSERSHLLSVSVSDDVSDDSFTTMLTHSIRFAALATLGYLQNGPNPGFCLSQGEGCTDNARAAAVGRKAPSCNISVKDTKQVSEKKLYTIVIGEQQAKRSE